MEGANINEFRSCTGTFHIYNEYPGGVMCVPTRHHQVLTPTSAWLPTSYSWCSLAPWHTLLTILGAASEGSLEPGNGNEGGWGAGSP